LDETMISAIISYCFALELYELSESIQQKVHRVTSRYAATTWCVFLVNQIANVLLL